MEVLHGLRRGTELALVFGGCSLAGVYGLFLSFKTRNCNLLLVIGSLLLLAKFHIVFHIELRMTY